MERIEIVQLAEELSKELKLITPSTLPPGLFETMRTNYRHIINIHPNNLSELVQLDLSVQPEFLLLQFRHNGNYIGELRLYPPT